MARRSHITIWLSTASHRHWEPDGSAHQVARSSKYSDLAIEAALTLRLLFHRSVRPKAFSTSLFVLMGLDLPVA